MMPPYDQPYEANSQPSEKSNSDEVFVGLLSECRRPLLGYIASLVGNRHDAEDVLQKTSVTLWRKMDTFEQGTDFMAWATTIAFYEAKNFIRKSGRAHVAFSNELMEMLARERADDLSCQDARLAALDECLKSLEGENRKLVCGFYLDREPILELAAKMGRATQTIYNRLNLIRRQLMQCVTDRNNESVQANP